jgi:small subunit ribosomal protein S21
MQVLVRDNNVEQALRVLKKKMQREGIFRELRQRKNYEKPSEKKNREKAEAIRRTRKAARKQMQREGLLPMPKLKPKLPGRGRPGMPSRDAQPSAERANFTAPAAAVVKD